MNDFTIVRLQNRGREGAKLKGEGKEERKMKEDRRENRLRKSYENRIPFTEKFRMDPEK